MGPCLGQWVLYVTVTWGIYGGTSICLFILYPFLNPVLLDILSV